MLKHSSLLVLTLAVCGSAHAQIVDKKVQSLAEGISPPNKAERGEGPMTNTDPLKLNLKAVQEAFDDSPNDANVATFEYRPEYTAKVRTRVGVRTIINFDPTETIKSFVVGNPEIFNVMPIQSGEYKKGFIPYMLTVKAAYAGTDTNLAVITESNRIYNFYVRSDPVNSKFVPHFTVYMKIPDKGTEKQITLSTIARITDISETAISQTTSLGGDDDKRKAKPKLFTIQRSGDNDYLKSLEESDNINTDYRIKGAKAIAPYAVYDDGSFTYFDYRDRLASDRLPVVYKVVDGYDTLVNFNIVKGFVVAESLSPEGWTLRNGQKYACIKPTKPVGVIQRAPLKDELNDEYKAATE